MPRIALVSAALWDLRAQCESQMRAVTDAQRVIDHYRDTPHTQEQAKARLLEDLAAIVQAHATIDGALRDYETLIRQLPTDAIPSRPAVSEEPPQ